MVLATAKSKNGILIRLTDERWRHVFQYHKEFNIQGFREICRIVKNPDVVFAGKHGELLAAKRYRKRKWKVVVYKERWEDGFVITAYLTSDSSWLFKRKIIWSKKL